MWATDSSFRYGARHSAPRCWIDHGTAPVADVELDELVVAGFRLQDNPNHGRLAILIRHDDDAFRIPRERCDLGTDTEIVVHATDLLLSFAQRGEKCEQFVPTHPRAIVNDGPAVLAKLIYGLPFNAKLDLSGTGFERVSEEFPRPLIGAAGFEQAVYKMRCTSNSYFHDMSFQR